MDRKSLQQTLAVLQQRLLHALRESLQGLQEACVTLSQALRHAGARGWTLLQPRLQQLQGALLGAWTLLRQRVPQRWPAWWPGAEAPPGVRRVVELWHRGECWVAVAAFGFIAAIMLLDVIGRELLGPLLRLVGLEPGATGIFAAQKLSVFALVIGSFVGIGIATATGSHIAPRFAYGWVPESWGPFMDRLADVLTGLFLVAVAWFGFKFVGSSLKTDLRAPVLDWPVWPIQLAIPLGFLSAAGRYFFYAVWPALKPLPPEFQE